MSLQRMKFAAMAVAGTLAFSGVGPASAAEVELLNVQSDPIQAEISGERFRELKPVAGERVFIRPRRFDLFTSQLH